MKIQDVDIEILKSIIESSRYKKEVLRKLDIAANNGNQMLLLNDIIEREKIDIGHFHYHMNLGKIVEILPTCRSIREVASKLGLVSNDAVVLSTKQYSKIGLYI